jgi:hypothetical protein
MLSDPVYQRLVTQLKWVRSFVEYARYVLEPGPRESGDQFPRQLDADKAMAELDAVMLALVSPPPDEPPPVGIVGELMADLGLVDGATLASVQRRLHVDAPTGMRLLALREAFKAITAAPPDDPPHWRPIATAPKDGQSILVHFKTIGIYQVFWSEAPCGAGIGAWCVTDNKNEDQPLRGYPSKEDATHWMPLPSVPHEWWAPPDEPLQQRQPTCFDCGGVMRISDVSGNRCENCGGNRVKHAPPDEPEAHPREDDGRVFCEWSLDDVGGDSVWETTCGHAFQFNDGGPAENHMAFCGYCGKPLVETLTSEDVHPSDVHAAENKPNH